MELGGLPDRCDVAIAGGGPAGAAAAITLARLGYRVLLADAGQGLMPRVGEGLPANARMLLRELGVLDRVLAEDHRPSSGSHAFWQEYEASDVDAMFGLHGFGLQLDRSHFDAGLRQAAIEAGSDCLEGVQLRLVTAADREHPHTLLVHAAAQDPVPLQARWLIDATGRCSRLARGLGAERRVHDRLLAFHQRFTGGVDRDRDARTWIQAEPDGWWYSVLLPTDQCLVVFVGEPTASERQHFLAPGGLQRRLERAPQLLALCSEAGWQPQGSCYGVDASSAELDAAAGHQWLAVGDAALAFDPLASKGIANALYTGLKAAHTIRQADAGDQRAGSAYATHLAAIHQVYRQDRQAIYQLVQRWSDRPFWRDRHSDARTLMPAL